MRFWLPLLVAVLVSVTGISSGETLLNQPYKTGAGLTQYEQDRCKLDLYLPKDAKDFPVLVWFHGGGLTGGNKDGADTKKIAESLAKVGIAVAVPNYRLSPKVTYPAYIQDSAAAVVWVQTHLAEHGGDPKKLFIGGHSAGGYLALLLGMDAHYLSNLGLKPSAIAGLVSVSGQVMTHYTVREERGIGKFTITADEAAPVFHARKDTPPMLILYADHDMVARAEENAYLVAILKGTGNTGVTSLLVKDRTHGSIGGKIANDGDPAREAILQFIASRTKGK